MTASRPRRALIYAGQAENVGDLAIIMSGAALLRDAGIADVAVSQWGAPTGPARAAFAAAGLRLVPSKRLGTSLAASWGALHVVGGGQLVRANQSAAALTLLLARLAVGRLSGGRAVALGLGVGDPGGGLRGGLWRQILRLCEAVCVRDNRSREIAARLGVEPVLTGDLVFLLDGLFDGAGAAPRDTVVVAPCIDPGEGRRVEPAHVAGLVAEARRRWPDARIVFALHDAALDRGAAEFLAREAGIAADVLDSGDPRDFAALYARSRLTLTNRLHAVIFSLCAGAPVICLDDGGKMGAAAADMRLASLAVAARPAAADLAGLVDRAATIAADTLARERSRSERNREVLRRVLR